MSHESIRALRSLNVALAAMGSAATATGSTALPYAIVDTNQLNCYNDTGNVISPPAPGAAFVSV